MHSYNTPITGVTGLYQLHLPTHVAAIALGSPLPVGEPGGLSRYGRGPWGPFAILGSYDYTPQLDKDNDELRG